MLWWLLNGVAGVETHHMFSRAVSQARPSAFASEREYTLHSVRSRSDEAVLGSDIRDELERHLATSLLQLVSADVEIHFLTAVREIVAQLIICPGPRVVVDSPARVVLELGAGRAFLSYLYTPPEYRRKGAAKQLLQLVCAQLHGRGYSTVVAHVRTTNVPSLNTFRNSGWEQVGTIWTRARGNWLASSGLKRYGISATRASENESE